MRRRTTLVLVLAALLVAGLSGVALAKVITGNKRPNVLIGTNQADTLSGKGANDSLCGGPGNDTYLGGKGNDVLVEFCDDSLPDGGNDTMSGGPGTDFILGEDGNDRIDAGDGNDIVGAARAPVPLVFGFEGNDRIRGGKGNDGLSGGDGLDEVYGEAGRDFLDGAIEDVPRADLIDGGPGRDTCLVDDLDIVRSCEVILDIDALSQQARDDSTMAARAREAFMATYGASP
jgi:Ca2+-binding RTX toxin-like protein